MKIFNRAKTHFMKKSETGAYNVKFGKVVDVHALINDILDGEKNKPTLDVNGLARKEQETGAVVNKEMVPNKSTADNSSFTSKSGTE